CLRLIRIRMGLIGELHDLRESFDRDEFHWCRPPSRRHLPAQEDTLAEPLPIARAVSHWAEDPWARGSWSGLLVGGTAADRAQLAQRVGDRLLLAGVAIHPAAPAMAHGAYESGLPPPGWSMRWPGPASRWWWSGPGSLGWLPAHAGRGGPRGVVAGS